MSALVTFVCHVAHPNEERSEVVPVVTMVGRQWAYCARGGSSDHQWQEIDPKPIGWLRMGLGSVGSTVPEAQRSR